MNRRTLISHFKPFTVAIITWVIAVQSLGVWAQSSTGKKTASGLEDLKLVEGDERGNEVKSVKTELLVAAAENRAIQQILLLIRKSRGTPLEPELHFRLAELYMRKAKTDRFFEIRRQSETVVRLAPTVVKSASLKKTVQSAISEYRFIQRAFPRYDQMDLVIFNAAFAHQSLNEQNAAEDLYWHLIKKFPQSALVPDSHLAIGEINFEAGKFQHALEHFDAIQKYPESKVYPYGLYKAAWAHYNLRSNEQAIKKLEEVVAYGKYVADNKIESRLDLRKEALADMTVFYEEVYPAKNAYTYFKKQAAELDVGPILFKLANNYGRHSKYAELQVVLNDFIREMPGSALLAQVHNELAISFDHLKNKGQAIAELERFYNLCDPSGSWVRSQKKSGLDPLKTSKDCFSMVSETSLRLAGKWLKSWKKSPTTLVEFADSAEKGFEIYLRPQPTGEEAAQARFAYAELLFQRQKFRAASTQYALVNSTREVPVKKSTSGSLAANLEASNLPLVSASSPQQLGHDASYAAILALEKAVADKWSNSDEEQFQKLSKVYLASYPKGQYRLDIEFKLALIAYEKERFDEAAPMFLRIGSQYAQTEKGQKAQDLYLDIYNLKKDYKIVRSYAKTLLSLSGLNRERSEKLQKIHEQAYFLEIQTKEQNGQFAEAQKDYQRFIVDNPKSDLVEKAHWNSMQLAFKTAQNFEGARMAEAYADRFPTSAKRTDALLLSAQTYESMALLNESALVLIKLSGIDHKSKMKWLELAADFFALSGNTQKAKKMYQDLRAGADHQLAQSMALKLANIERYRGTETSYQDARKQLMKLGIEPYASQYHIDGLKKKYQEGRFADVFSDAKQILGNSSAPKNLKAQARLLQAKILQSEFLQQSVKSRADRVAAVLALKTDKLQKAQEAFQSAIRFADPAVTVEALEQLAGCYTHFVKALKDMPRPPELAEKDEPAFRDELQKLIIPLEEKGVDTMAQAVASAKKFHFIDGTPERLEQELNRLNLKSSIVIPNSIGQPNVAVPLLAGVQQ